MGRRKGSHNKPDAQKTGPKPSPYSIVRKLPAMTAPEILDAKVAILEILTEGSVNTVAAACRMLNIPPMRAYNWIRTDKDFQEYLKDIQEVIADDIEETFLDGKNDIPKMMLLKGIRPKYRDNFKIIHSTERLEQDLEELKKLSQPKEEETEEV
jgi:hypothetical protein